jgi:hypothetical protein
MRLLRFVKRAALVVALSAVIFLVIVSVYLRIEQYRFRRQAEQLLSDVRELELEKASTAQVKVVVKKWGFEEWQPTATPCSEDECRYHFRLMSPDPGRLYERGYAHWDRIAHTLALFGARPAAVDSWIQIRGKEVRSAWFAVYTLGRGEDGGNCTLMADAGTKGGSSFSAHDQPEVKLNHSLLHPSYLVGTFAAMLNVDTFQASPAAAIWAEFSPGANAADVSRLMQFDLSCLTRLRSCRDRDLMPTVWAQSVEDSRETPKSLTCTPELSRRVAQLADVIVLARPETIALRQSSGEGWPPELPNLGIVSVIKKPKHPRQLGRLDVGVESPQITTADTRSPVRAGQQYLFLLQVHDYRTSGWIALYPCGILTVNASNLAMVREAASSTEATE